MLSSKIYQYLIILVLSSVLIVLSHNVFAFKNEPDDFRGIKWGTDIKDLPDMVLEKGSKGNEKSYTRKNDKLQIGNAALNSVSYYFYKGKFYLVWIEFHSISAVAIKQTLSHQYGKHDEEKTSIYLWAGGKVTILLNNSKIRKSTLMYTYKPISDKMDADELESAKKGASDL